MGSGPDRGTDILSCLIRNGEIAVKSFAKLSKGEWFDEAPEYFLTTYLASGILKLDKSSALLEVHVGETRKEAGAYRRRRPASSEGSNGRYDLVVYWGNGNPRGAIEVKSPLSVADEKRLVPNFERLCETVALCRDSSFQFGAFVYYASVSDPIVKHHNASGKLRELVKRIHSKAVVCATKLDLIAVPWPGSVRRGGNDEGGAWCIAAEVFVRSGGEQYFRK